MRSSMSSLLSVMLALAALPAAAGEGTTEHRGAPPARSQPRARVLWLQSAGLDRASVDSGRPEGFGRLARTLFSKGFESEEAVDFNITKALLQTCDVAAVVGTGRRYSNLEARDIKSWVEGGGGLLVLAGPAPTDTATRNTLIEAFGIRFTGERSIGRPELVTDLEAHPVTRGVKAISGALGFFLDAASPARALARLEGKAVLAVSEHGKGRVAVLYSEQPWFNGPVDRRVVFTDLDGSDNQKLALSLLAWLAARPMPF